MTWLIQLRHDTSCDMTHLCETWHIRVWLDSFTCDTSNSWVGMTGDRMQIWQHLNLWQIELLRRWIQTLNGYLGHGARMHRDIKRFQVMTKTYAREFWVRQETFHWSPECSPKFRNTSGGVQSKGVEKGWSSYYVFLCLYLYICWNTNCNCRPNNPQVSLSIFDLCVYRLGFQYSLVTAFTWSWPQNICQCRDSCTLQFAYCILRNIGCKCKNITRGIMWQSGDVAWSHGTHEVGNLWGKFDGSTLRKQCQKGKKRVVMLGHRGCCRCSLCTCSFAAGARRYRCRHSLCTYSFLSGARRCCCHHSLYSYSSPSEPIQ